MSCLRWLKLERGKQTQTGCNCLVNILWQYVEVLGLGELIFGSAPKAVCLSKNTSHSVCVIFGGLISCFRAFGRFAKVTQAVSVLKIEHMAGKFAVLLSTCTSYSIWFVLICWHEIDREQQKLSVQ